MSASDRLVVWGGELFTARAAHAEFMRRGAYVRVLIVVRWFPYGPHIVNSAAGAYEVPLGRHACCAAVSIVPPALIISALANGLFVRLLE